MKGGVKEFKKAYKHVNIDDIEVGIYINNLYKNQSVSHQVMVFVIVQIYFYHNR